MSLETDPKPSDHQNNEPHQSKKQPIPTKKPIFVVLVGAFVFASVFAFWKVLRLSSPRAFTQKASPSKERSFSPQQLPQEKAQSLAEVFARSALASQIELPFSSHLKRSNPASPYRRSYTYLFVNRHAMQVADAEPLLLSPRWLSPKEKTYNIPFLVNALKNKENKSVLVIFADGRLPHVLLIRFMYTGGQAGYSRVRVAFCKERRGGRCTSIDLLPMDGPPIGGGFTCSAKERTVHIPRLSLRKKKVVLSLAKLRECCNEDFLFLRCFLKNTKNSKSKHITTLSSRDINKITLFLERIKNKYPDERRLLLELHPETTLGSIIRAKHHAVQTTTGKTLFSDIQYVTTN